jgi:vanillate/3-O-methylgallate O-demethylase
VSGPNAIKVLQKLDSSDALLKTKFMWVSPLTVAGHQVWALRQGMSGEVGFELQGPAEYGREVYEAVLAAGQEFGIRRMGARVAMINHLEAAYPTIATDYIPAIFDDDTAEYLDVFLSSMPSFAQPAYIAGSYPGNIMSRTCVLTLFSQAGRTAKSQSAGKGSASAQAWWGGWGSNPRPADYESAALTC